MPDEREVDLGAQELMDSFYWGHGPCCAGCDWWCASNSLFGECRNSPPVSGEQRASMLGMRNVTTPIPAGHILTKRDHRCGGFKDEFDWTSLPLAYRKRIGAPIKRGDPLP